MEPERDISVWNRNASLLADLTTATRLASDAASDPPRSEQLAELESEHRALCTKRRFLHESIDLLAGLAVLKPDAAARLELYQATERKVSQRRADVYRLIRELQVEQSLHSDQN